MSEFPANRELVLSRLIDAPRTNVWRCWTEADLLKKWFAPAPYIVSRAEIDARPGGRNRLEMQGPDGQSMPSEGVYLDVVEGSKLVFTDAFAEGWEPKDGAPFMVVIVTLEDEDDGTRYTARARHWSVEAAQQHESMGFAEGWGMCASQMEAVAKTLTA
jgi:uncharacterized protein YndB with AHSA1/START domain